MWKFIQFDVLNKHGRKTLTIVHIKLSYESNAITIFFTHNISITIPIGSPMFPDVPQLIFNNERIWTTQWINTHNHKTIKLLPLATNHL